MLLALRSDKEEVHATSIILCTSVLGVWRLVIYNTYRSTFTLSAIGSWQYDVIIYMLNFQVTNLEAVFLPSVKTTDKLCTPSLTSDNFSRRRKVLLTCIVMWTNIHLLTSYMMCFINARWILAYMYIYLYVWSQKPNRCPRLQLRHVVGLV